LRSEGLNSDDGLFQARYSAFLSLDLEPEADCVLNTLQGHFTGIALRVAARKLRATHSPTVDRFEKVNAEMKSKWIFHGAISDGKTIRVNPLWDFVRRESVGP
jgi:hypothetical protein